LDPNRLIVFRSLVILASIDSVGGSEKCAPTKTFAAKSPLPPTNGSLWQLPQAVASGPASLWKLTSLLTRMVGFESPVAMGRPAPSATLNLVLNKILPSSTKSRSDSLPSSTARWSGKTVIAGGSQLPSSDASEGTRGRPRSNVEGSQRN